LSWTKGGRRSPGQIFSVELKKTRANKTIRSKKNQGKDGVNLMARRDVRRNPARTKTPTQHPEPSKKRKRYGPCHVKQGKKSLRTTGSEGCRPGLSGVIKENNTNKPQRQERSRRRKRKKKTVVEASPVGSEEERTLRTPWGNERNEGVDQQFGERKN